jgi:Holliday junction resolvase
MPNKNKQKGTRFEYRVKAYYEKLGYDVHRKYSSIGVMDLICICHQDKVHMFVDEGPGICQVLYVQCKVRKNLMRPTETIALVEHANKYGGLAILAYKDKKRHIVTELLN